MSRDFIGTTVGRAFRQSPNRDRITRTGTQVADWLVQSPSQYIGNEDQVVLLDGMGAVPQPPPDFIYEDLRAASNNGTTAASLFPGNLSDKLYARKQLPQFNTSAITGAPVVGANTSSIGIASRLPAGARSGFFRATFRCWGLHTLANLHGSTSAAMNMSRLGNAAAGNPYPPPDFTFYDKNPIGVFLFRSFFGSPMLSPDFDSFGGIPMNTFTLDPTQREETKELYWFDRIITCSVTIGTVFGDDSPALNQANQYPSGTESDGSVLERIQTNGNKSRIHHRGLHRPNGSLLNPPNPIIVLDNFFAGGSEDRTNVFIKGQPDSYYFRRAGFLVHLAMLDRLPAYEPPTITILRQEIVS